MREKIQCQNCAAWSGEINSEQAACMLHPPQAIMAQRVNPMTQQPEPITLSFWPLTAPNVGCFDGVPKETVLNS